MLFSNSSEGSLPALHYNVRTQCRIPKNTKNTAVKVCTLMHFTKNYMGISELCGGGSSNNVFRVITCWQCCLGHWVAHSVRIFVRDKMMPIRSTILLHLQRHFPNFIQPHVRHFFHEWSLLPHVRPVHTHTPNSVTHPEHIWRQHSLHATSTTLNVKTVPATLRHPASMLLIASISIVGWIIGKPPNSTSMPFKRLLPSDFKAWDHRRQQPLWRGN